jgi:uncharacterized membrane protein
MNHKNEKTEKGMELMAEDKGTEVRESITINRPVEEVYTFWRNFENLPRFMEHLESVTVVSQKRSHWKAKAPLGMDVEWDAEIVEDVPNRRIAWQSVDDAVHDAEVTNAGWVEFAPANGGTQVTVSMRYSPPAGKLGTLVAKLFGDEPSQTIPENLRRFKQVMETGYVTQA